MSNPLTWEAGPLLLQNLGSICNNARLTAESWAKFRLSTCILNLLPGVPVALQRDAAWGQCVLLPTPMRVMGQETAFLMTALQRLTQAASGEN